MANWKRVTFYASVFYLTYTAPSEGVRPPISLEVSPRSPTAGECTAEVRVKWRIDPHPDNRKHSLVAVSDNGDYHFTEGDLHGDEEKTLYPVCTEDNPRPCYRTVRKGLYVFEACVYRTGNLRFCDKKKVNVR